MEKFSIFIIGPTGNELAHHTAAIKVGVEKALARLAFLAFDFQPFRNGLISMIVM